MFEETKEQNLKTILVVEDDSFLSSLIKAKLEKEGYKVIEAEDGDTALSKTKESNPDLVLLDLILPGKEGAEVLKEIKEDQELKNIPVIILTNLGTDKDIEKLMQLGATDYMIKANFTPAEIAKKARDILK